jgi:hypothetical protein
MVSSWGGTPDRVGHPSPHRRRVSAWAIGFGLLASLLIWPTHLVTNLALASSACAFGSRGTPDDLTGLLLLNSLCALFICAAAGWTSWQTWDETRHEHKGAHERLLEVGEGRTRFLGLVGMVLAGGFFAATIFDTLGLFMVPPCA